MPQRVAPKQSGRAWLAITQIFISKISEANNIHLLRATVKTIAAYGMESVPLTLSLCRQIETSHCRMLRDALGIIYFDT